MFPAWGRADTVAPLTLSLERPWQHRNAHSSERNAGSLESECFLDDHEDAVVALLIVHNETHIVNVYTIYVHTST